MARLIEAARYHPGDINSVLQHQAETAAMVGDHTTLQQLEREFGVKPVDYKKVADGFKRVDPEGVLGTIVINMCEYKKGTPKYNLLHGLHDEYLKVPEEQRTSERLNEQFRATLRQIIESK